MTARCVVVVEVVVGVVVDVELDVVVLVEGTGTFSEVVVVDNVVVITGEGVVVVVVGVVVVEVVVVEVVVEIVEGQEVCNAWNNGLSSSLITLNVCARNRSDATETPAYTLAIFSSPPTTVTMRHIDFTLLTSSVNGVVGRGRVASLSRTGGKATKRTQMAGTVGRCPFASVSVLNRTVLSAPVTFELPPSM